MNRTGNSPPAWAVGQEAGMAIETPFTELFGLRHPIALAPMGGLASGALTAAVSNAGSVCSAPGAAAPAGWRASCRLRPAGRNGRGTLVSRAGR
jgi:hypothetical protein